MALFKKVVEHGNTTAHITSLLRQDIIRGEVLPGSRLVISELAKRYEIGAIPLRESLRWLEGEGLLISEPNRGWSVRNLDSQFIKDVCEIRIALETMLLKRAVTEITQDDLLAIKHEQLSIEEAVKDGDVINIRIRDSVFHGLINKLGGNSEAALFLERGLELINAFRQVYGVNKRRMELIPQEHAAIIDALECGDQIHAVAAMQRHQTAARNDLLSLLER